MSVFGPCQSNWVVEFSATPAAKRDLGRHGISAGSCLNAAACGPSRFEGRTHSQTGSLPCGGKIRAVHSITARMVQRSRSSTLLFDFATFGRKASSRRRNDGGHWATFPAFLPIQSRWDDFIRARNCLLERVLPTRVDAVNKLERSKILQPVSLILK